MTGGHAGATAYALSEALRKDKNFNWKIHFIGARSALEGKSVATYEQEVLPTIGVTYHGIDAGRLQRKFSVNTIPSILKIPVGLVQAIRLVLKINPDIILSFGGFVGFPVVLAGKLIGKKVVIHEQTAVYGRANKASEIFADRIALSRKTSAKHFDLKKAEVIGNPVSAEITSIKHKKTLASPPVILVTGGSRGSQIINETVALILPKLLSNFKVIHQVGDVEKDKYLMLKDNLGELGSNYEVFGVIPPTKWYQMIEKSDMIVSRAGANIVSELMVVKRPAILVPIPWTFADEQNKNALSAKEFGIARILPQEKLTPENLLAEIEAVMKNWEKIVKETSLKKSPDINASKALVDLLISVIK